MKISSILATKRSDIITIQPHKTVRDALALLAKHNIGALIVTDLDAKVVGILSERDIVRMAAKSEDFFSVGVDQVMTRNVVVGMPQDDVMSVAHTMTERRFRHLPVLDGDVLVGIVSLGDLMKAQRDHYLGELDTLETQILAGDD